MTPTRRGAWRFDWRVLLLTCAAAGACRTTVGPDMSDNAAALGTISTAGAPWDLWPLTTISITGSVSVTARVLPTVGPTSDIQTALDIHNTGATTAHLEYGACSLGLRLYSDASLSGTPVWDNRPSEPVACVLIAYSRDLQVGQSVEIDGPHFDPTKVTPTLPPGTYTLAVTWRERASVVHVVPAGNIESRR